jgi:hypothetical protein
MRWIFEGILQMEEDEMSLFSFFSGIAYTAGQSKSSHQGLRLIDRMAF